MGERIYKTADGEYVPHGHPDARFLAFSEHDEPPADVLAKMKPKAEDKQRKRQARNKTSAKQTSVDALTAAGTDPKSTAKKVADEDSGDE